MRLRPFAFVIRLRRLYFHAVAFSKDTEHLGTPRFQFRLYSRRNRKVIYQKNFKR